MHTHMASANAFLIISSHWHCCLHIQGALLSQCSAPLPPIAPTSTSAPRGSLELRRLVCPPSIGQAPGPEGMSGCERVTRGSLGAGGSSIQQPWLVRYQRRAIQHGKVRGKALAVLLCLIKICAICTFACLKPEDNTKPEDMEGKCNRAMAQGSLELC